MIQKWVEGLEHLWISVSKGMCMWGPRTNPLQILKDDCIVSEWDYLGVGVWAENAQILRDISGRNGISLNIGFNLFYLKRPLRRGPGGEKDVERLKCFSSEEGGRNRSSHLREGGRLKKMHLKNCAPGKQCWSYRGFGNSRIERRQVLWTSRYHWEQVWEVP